MLAMLIEQILVQAIVTISVELAKVIITPTLARVARQLRTWFK